MSLDLSRREQLVNHLTQRAQQLGIASPAIIFLEMYKPLAFLGAQLLWASQPFLSLWWRDMDIHELALLLEDRVGVDTLIQRLETTF